MKPAPTHTSEPDAEKVDALSQLDDQRLTALIDRWRGAIIGLARAWGSKAPVDLAQEVFAEAWLSRERFRGDWDDPAATAPWLRGIAWNLAAAERRRRARQPQPLDATDEPSTPADDGTADHQAMIRRAVDRLPTDLRAAVLVHYLERTPVRETAALLGTSEKTIEGRLYRARQRLAELLQPAPQGAR